MLSLSGRHALLDVLPTVMYASIHTDHPGESGATEVATARQLMTFQSADAGKRLLGTQPTVQVPANTRVRYIGFWSEAVNGVFIGGWPCGGDEKAAYPYNDGSTLWCPDHGLTLNTPIVLGPAPLPLVPGTIYYATTITTHTFRVAAVPNGLAITLTQTPLPEYRVSRIVEQAFGSAGQLTVSFGAIGMAASVSNSAPVWNPSVIQINLSPGQQFDLRSICADPEGDIMLFSSGGLSGIATLASNGILTAIAPGSVSTLFTADDGH